MPGNGASSDRPAVHPQQEMTAASVVEKPAAVVKVSKTPKLSRLFGKGSSKASSSKRTAGTSTSGSPILPLKSTTKAGNSPKTDKRSSSKTPANKSSVNGKSTAEAPASPRWGVHHTKSSSGKSPKRSLASSVETGKMSNGSSKRDVKSYGFSYESCHPQQQQQQMAAPGSSLCPSEGYESGGSDSGVHLGTASLSPVKMNGGRGSQQQRPVLMPSIGEVSRCSARPCPAMTMMPGMTLSSSSGTSTSGSGGSGGRHHHHHHHYESSGYESTVVRDSECSSLGSSSQDSDRGGIRNAGRSDHQMTALAVPPAVKPTPIGKFRTKLDRIGWRCD